jgi:superoxide dismutase, Cu-Zn family
MMTQKKAASTTPVLIFAIGIFAFFSGALTINAQGATATPTGETGHQFDSPDAAVTTSVQAHAVLRDGTGTPAGVVWFIEEPATGTIAVAVQARGLEPGFAGMSFNAVGNCDVAGSFSASGGVIAREGENYPYRAGDMPPLYVISDGTTAMSFRTDYVTMADLMDGDGASVLIYENPGSFALDGAAADTRGVAIACGTVESGEPPSNIYEGVVTDVDGTTEATPEGDEMATPVPTQAGG